MKVKILGLSFNPYKATFIGEDEEGDEFIIKLWVSIEEVKRAHLQARKGFYPAISTPLSKYALVPIKELTIDLGDYDLVAKGIGWGVNSEWGKTFKSMGGDEVFSIFLGRYHDSEINPPWTPGDFIINLDLFTDNPSSK